MVRVKEVGGGNPDNEVRMAEPDIKEVDNKVVDKNVPLLLK
jgi:hypothetical protein